MADHGSDGAGEGTGLEVAVVGMAGRFPGADDIHAFWRNLRAGVESISFFTREELLAGGSDPAVLDLPGFVPAGGELQGADEFDAGLFDLTPRDAQILNPQHRVFLECAWAALEHAGYDPARLDRPVGVFAGSGTNEYLAGLSAMPDLVRSVGMMRLTLANEKDHLAAGAAYRLNLRGPAVGVQTACSTSLVSVHVACQSLINGECDVAMAGGVSIMLPLRTGYVHTPDGTLSPDGHCRAFDADSRGSVCGAGAGVVVLRRLEDALADGDTIHAVIRGSAINNDGGQKVGYTAPSVTGQARVISEALSVAGVDPATVQYLETHGTGTPLGDAIELKAIGQVLSRGEREHPCAIGSVKTNVGHLDAASGVTGLIKTVLSLSHGELPPSLHCATPHPEIAASGGRVEVNTALRAWERNGTLRRAGVSSFGMGGTNAHVVLEEAPAAEDGGPSRPFQLLVISARTPSALATAANNLADALETDPPPLADAAHTLRTGRRELEHRLAVVCRDPREGAARLREAASRGTKPVPRTDRPAAFMFPGVGTHFVDMGRGLYDAEPVYRQTVDECCELLRPVLGSDLRHVLFSAAPPAPASAEGGGWDLRGLMGGAGEEGAAAGTPLDDTRFAQPAVFVTEYALAKLWMSWGVRPRALIGHSLGEYVAACVAGVLRLEDALRLVALRARLIDALPAGAMLAVPLGEDALRPLLPAALDVAAVNTPGSCVVAGPAAEVEAFEVALAERGTVSRRLPARHAFHSRAMAPVAEELARLVAGFELRAPEIPFVSNETGTWIADDEARSPAYWARHLCGTVRFADGVATLRAEPGWVLVEVGPGQALGAWALQHPAGGAPEGHVVLSSLRHQHNRVPDQRFLLEALGGLWTAGVAVDWTAFGAGERRRRVPLPGYPFERKRYLVDLPRERGLGERSRADTDHAGDGPANGSHEKGRGEMNDRQAADEIATAPSPRHQAVLGVLKGIAAELTGIDEEHVDAGIDLFAAGFDSLLLLQAIQAIEKRVGVRVSLVEMLEELTTLDALAGHLDRVLPPEAMPASAPAPAAPASAPAFAPVLAPAAVAQTSAVAEAAPPQPRVVPAPPSFYPAAPSHGGPGDGGASGTVLERVIAQQLQVMGQQLSALRGEAPAAYVEAPSSPEPASAPASPAASASAALPVEARPADSVATADVPSRNGSGAHGVAVRPVEQSPRAKIQPPTFVAFQPVNPEGAGGFTAQQRAFLDDFVARYTERTKGSKAHQVRYHRALADTRVTARFRRAWKEMLYPIVSARALGSKIWDVDGNEYVDTGMAFGCNLFGHAPPFVSKAIQDQVERGYGVGPQSPHAGRAAELICELGGNDRAVFCNSGTEAVMGAIRAARTFTGRSKIAYFSGSYHGWADVMLGRLLPGEKRLVKPAAPGIPDLPLGDVMMLDWDEPSSLELLARHIDELALVMVEPVQSRRLDIQPRAFIQEVRRITSEAGALLLFDELITGFRVLPGGAQAYFGVKADLVTYGKIVAGGLPMGVVSGREEVMAVFDGGMWSYGDDSYPTSQRTVFAGAFFKHPLSMAVAVSILEEIRRQGVPMYEALNARTERLVDRINAFFEAGRYPATVVRFASSFRFFFGPEVQFPDLFNHHLVHEGIYMIPETGTHFLSTAHTDEDLERYYRAVVASARALRRGGFMPGGPDDDGEPDPEPEPAAPFRLRARIAADSPPPAPVRPSTTADAVHAVEAGVRTLPVSEGQRQLWIESQMGDDANCAYIESSSMRLRGLDVDAMRSALRALVARHDTLRMTFDADGETQRIHPTVFVDVPLEDLRGVPAAEREQALAAWVRGTVQRPFDLVDGPLVRFALAALADDEHVLAFTFHHAALDGWSAGVVMADLAELYDAAVQRRPASLAPRPDHAAMVRAQVEAFGDGSEAEAYWRAQFAGGVPVLELPTDRPRPAVRSYAGGRVERMAEMDLLARLSAAGRRHGLTMFNTLLAAVFVWLERVTGQDELVVGTPAAGQATRPGAAEMVGFDINVLPVRARVDPASSFAEQARRIRRAVMGAIEHQHVSIPRLVETLLRTRDASRPPLFSVLMHLDRDDGPTSFAGLPARHEVNFGGGSKVDLTFDLNETPHGLSLRLIYAAALFDEDTAARWLASFQRMLEAIAADPEQRVSDLALTGPEERAQVAEWNRTEHPYPHACIHALFEAQAALTPDAVAVVCGAERVTYAELDARANRLARHLRGLGVGPEDRVALCLERGPELLVAFFGILKAGAAYVPLDAGHPADRLAYMLADSGARLLVTQQTLLARLPAERPECVLVDAQAAEIAAEPARPVESGVGPENLAYVYYTSGSTGRPKGVAMHHYGPANYFAWGREAYGAGVGRGAPVFSSMAVDLTLANFLPLFTGAAVELLPEGPGVEPLADALRAGGGFGMIKITPTHLALLNHALTPAQAAASTATLVVGADNLFAEPTVFWQRHAPGVRLLNEYGPTETVVGCSLYAIPNGKHVEGRVPIGRPIWNLTMYVLDGALHPVPPGIPGELYIGGVGVARGYLGRPALTAEKFVPDPFAAAPGARLYRTGDRARFLADGNLEFLGRVDFQVKIRGYRVEPGEVESVLSAHPGVRSALVTPREDEPGDVRLVAYVVPDGPAAASAEELRSALRERLPEHMVPSAFVFMDDFPTGSTGKVDRKALPAPERSGPDDGYAPPRTPVEETLAGIWAGLLRVDRVGVRDDFFALGGHSLLATRVVSRVRQVLGVELSLRALFEAPTVAGLAARVEALRRADVPPLPPVLALDRSGPLPLSFAQERLWFLDRLQPGGTFYNVPVPLRLEGALDVAALERALGEIIRRHEALRTTLREVDGSPVQVVAPFDGFELPVEDLSALDADEREAELKRQAAAEAAATFDLAMGPLFRARLLRLADDDHALLLGMHHVVNDEWSVSVLFRELAALYEAYRQGGESPLPELAVQYADHAVWQREQLQGEALNRSLSWWRERLAGAPELLDLPTDRPRPAMQSYRGAFEPIELPRGLLDRLEALARAEGATLFMVLLGAFDVLLSRYSGSEDIVVGTTIAGRTRAEVEPLIGLFMNTLVLRTDLSGAGDFREVLRRVRDVTLGAYEHQEIPFERLVSELRPERNLGHSPLFQVLLELHNTESAGAGLPGLRVRGVEMENTTAKLDLNVSLRATPEGLVGGMNYSTDLFDASTARRLIDHLARVLEQVADDAAIRLADLTLVDEAERAQLTERWNQTAAAYPATSTIHGLFEAQASRTPDAVAVTFGGRSLTYAELDARANQVAHHLQRLGVGPEVRVGICLERSLELLPSILGVMKAGGAYVPVDPAHPAERIGYVLSDSAVSVLVTQSPLAARCRVDAQVTVVSVDTASSELSKESADPPSSQVTSENLAYVIYTSGSTGRPKGVAMHHRGVANYLHWGVRAYGANLGSGSPVFSSMAVDLTVTNLLPLFAGRAVHLLPEENAVEALAAALREKPGFGLIKITPVHLSLLTPLLTADEAWGAAHTLVIGADFLSAEPTVFWQENAPGVRLMNEYGPTETVVGCSAYALPNGVHRTGAVPVGGPIQNLRFYVLDAHGQPVPAGLPGELYIGGAGVARGYLGRPGLTAEKFVPEPFGEPGARMYRTGDRARWQADGELLILGRTDNQVKIRGYRVELGEIEAVLRRHLSVTGCLVVVREDVPGDKRLVAYVGVDSESSTDSADAAGSVDSNALREHVRASLPEYMVPAAFVVMESLPQTATGKIDPKTLPAPQYGSAEASYVAPRTPVEETLAEIWAEMLNVERAGLTDDFFTLGGHSLLAMRLLARIRSVFGVELSIRSVFSSRTLEAVAAEIEQLVLEMVLAMPDDQAEATLALHAGVEA